MGFIDDKEKKNQRMDRSGAAKVARPGHNQEEEQHQRTYHRKVVDQWW